MELHRQMEGCTAFRAARSRQAQAGCALQTILAYEMNDQTLPIANGAPLRLRVERQLGYKMAKYVMRIEAVDHIAGIRGGRGGFWEDLGYEWYAGI
jgi:DMSO/TMAO reductase YedYZ molybdopterin-dependent catalytic subunit